MLPNVLTNALIPMRYYVTLNTLLGISRVTLHITTNTSYDLNRKEFNVLLAVALLACTHPG